MPVLISSGYDERENLGASLDGRTAFLQKPYRIAQLRAAIHALLDVGSEG